MAKLLARFGVGEMHLHHRQANGRNGITQRDRGVGIPAGIDNHSACPTPGVVQSVNQRALVIRLQTAHLDPQLFSFVFQSRVNLRQRHRAVDLRLARAEQVQVRAVENENRDGRWEVESASFDIGH